ncbi:hypothetical protein D3C86_1822830 [compost metagenome]
MTVKGKQQCVADGHGAAKEDQFAPIALTVGALRQPQADQDPGDGINGIKQPHPEWLGPHLAAQE